eukprot:TRINITY_DN20941_c0_g1_i2.p2 TRINITY_DN20941_c0_g1~~TRINITY_DN20941_c0_g1_i2.p2  ORF type:complete len:135 (+),score=12.34 TRINITY_DN20941_c0_g1_i2:595-999(+)
MVVEKLKTYPMGNAPVLSPFRWGKDSNNSSNLSKQLTFHVHAVMVRAARTPAAMSNATSFVDRLSVPGFVLLSVSHTSGICARPVSYTHLRAHETPEHLVCRLLLEKKKKRKRKLNSVITNRNSGVDITMEESR